MLIRLIVPLCLALLWVSEAVAEEVALTFDDLPTLSLSNDVGFSKRTTTVLLDGLRRRGLTATGFVNEGKLEGVDKSQKVALLSQWLDAGMDLGNHSYSHMSLSKTPLRAYIADVQRGETVTRPLLQARGRTLHWFRHPYLETGSTVHVRRTFDAWLASRGYQVAPVTMENADWMFAYPYDEALQHGDRVAAGRIKSEYLAYTAAAVGWYQSAALHLLGRRPSFVFLLHASRLNADTIDGLADILRTKDLRAVTLDRAMQDPAFQIADGYAGPNGDEWISRWSRTLHRDLPWSSFPEPPVDIAAAEKRLDTEP